MRNIPVVLAALLLLPSTLQAQAHTSKSTVFAVELAKLLDEQKLDSIAARQGGDQFVSAIYFPGQLLVVGGKYSAPDRLAYLITQKSYKDAYADLSSAAEQTSKLFVMDLGANGLRFARESNNLDTADIAGKSIAFDGEWKKAKISETDYQKAFETTDEQYAQMLQALIAALKK